MKIIAKDRGPLTPREHEALEWIARGKSSWETARLLGCSERTVNAHAASIVQKLDASNRTHAVVKALSRGLIVVQLSLILFIHGDGGADAIRSRAARRHRRRSEIIALVSITNRESGLGGVV